MTILESGTVCAINKFPKVTSNCVTMHVTDCTLCLVNFFRTLKSEAAAAVSNKTGPVCLGNKSSAKSQQLFFVTLCPAQSKLVRLLGF